MISLKLERLIGDNDYVSSIIRSIEEKIDKEIGKRLQHEFENKKWLELKLSTFRAELVTVLKFSWQ